MPRVLLFAPRGQTRAQDARTLMCAAYDVTEVDTAAEAVDVLQRAALDGAPFDVVVADLTSPDNAALEVVHSARRAPRDVPEVIVLAAADRVEPALEALRIGASEYLIRPVHPTALTRVIERTLAFRSLADTNELLRQYVALADAARRVTTARDRPHLFSAAYSAFPQLTGAEAVLIYTRGEDHCSLQPGHALDRDTVARVAKYFSDELYAIHSLDQPREVASPLSDRRVFVYPARGAGPVRTFLVSFYTRAPTDAEESAGMFLASNLALGFEHLEHAAATRELVYRDHLTSLFNTRYLQKALDSHLDSANQRSQPFSVLFLDVDHFKRINDEHGHAIGSMALVELAKLLRRCVRESDTIVRYGGDEFVILLPKSDTLGALKVAERIRERVRDHRFLAREGHDIHLSACIGIASYPEHGEDSSRLLELADDAMYMGKRAERGLVNVARA